MLGQEIGHGTLTSRHNGQGLFTKEIDHAVVSPARAGSMEKARVVCIGIPQENLERKILMGTRDRRSSQPECAVGTGTRAKASAMAGGNSWN